MVNSAGWEFWKLDNMDGNLAWLGITRPGAKAVVDRRKVWTLIPARGLFVANWFVTEDHHRDGDKPGVWIHQNIDIEEARELALEVPEASEADMKRLRYPERCLTLEQLDNYPVSKILGSRVADSLTSRS